MTVLEAVLAVGCGLLALGWARSAWIGGDIRAALATAQDDRDVYATKLTSARADRDTLAETLGKLTAGSDDDTVRLPKRSWDEFLPAQPGLPADQVAATLDALERHANGEGR
jgi:hypothetical protein